jgi:hypothetical protein
VDISEDDEKLTKEKIISITKNEVPVASFTMAFTTDKATNMVFAATRRRSVSIDLNMGYYAIRHMSNARKLCTIVFPWDTG